VQYEDTLLFEVNTFVHHTEEVLSQPRSNFLFVLRLFADLELAGARDVVSMAVSVEPV
jgi:hypothetical protein